MPHVSPGILQWARETAGLTLEEATKKLGIREVGGKSPLDRLSALESGEAEPTRPMLLKMAKQYRRPLIVFYMEKQPRKGDRGQDFRTLPDSYSEESMALVDALLRDVLVRQSLMRSGLEDEEYAKPLKFVGSMQTTDSIDGVVQSIKRTIGIDLNDFRKELSYEKAFAYLREKIEAAGVFVLLMGDLGSHHTAFDLDVFRGFALSDEIAPFIVINDRDSRAAWSFTLLHELTHIWLGQTGISGSSYTELAIETLCNKVASELLLPEGDLSSLIVNNVNFDELKDRITDFASERNLSSSMVAYKLYLSGKLDSKIWRNLASEYRRLWLEYKEEKRDKAREKKGGPSYYVVRRHRLGENLISIVHQMILGGTLTTLKASKVLGVAPKNVQTLFEPNISFDIG